jgi:hypothetical protein
MHKEKIVKATERRRFDVAKDLTGQKIGYLFVLEPTDKRYHKKIIWKCRCICGKIVEKSSGELLGERNNKSCGCTLGQAGRTKYVGDLSGTTWLIITQRANKLNLGFDITQEYVWDLFLNQSRRCAISGVDIFFRTTAYTKGCKSDQTASLDRIDCEKGYVVGNVQWVHKTINYMKTTLSDENFIEWCQTVSDFQRDKQEKKVDTIRESD